MTRTNCTRVTLLSLGMLAGLFAGCSQERPAKSDAFFPNDEQGVTASVLEAQAARGARMDATLYPAHFTGSALNALGQAKLDLMLKDRAETLPLTLYLDLATENPHAADAVRTYLADTGLLASQCKLEFGPNPATLHPTAPGIAKLPKTDNPAPAKTSAAPVAEPEAGLDLSGLTGLLGTQKK